MAHHKSALKRIRQDKIRTARNRSHRTMVRNAIKNVNLALEQKNLESAQEAYQKMIPVLDKMTLKGIIHANAAARQKSRLNRKIKNLAQS